MKSLNWPTSAEQHAYMKIRQEQNRVNAKNNDCENWMHQKLAETPYKWTRQAQWGYRLFDFWCSELGVAIEVDGPEHDEKYDAYRDEYNFRRSGIVVLRVENWDEQQADEIINLLASLGAHNDRKQDLGITGYTKKVRRTLSEEPFDDSMLERFIEDLISKAKGQTNGA